MSIAFLDPGNIESDLQAGAVAGFKVLSWGLRAVGREVTRLRGWRPQLACFPRVASWMVVLGADVKFKWARRGSPGKLCQSLGYRGVNHALQQPLSTHEVSAV
jgi:hypothetical protein